MLTKIYETVKNAKLRMNGERIHQTDRNTMKQELVNVIRSKMKAEENENVKVFSVVEGIAVEVSHEELGAITFIIDLTMKELDYDAENEAELYAEEIAEKAKVKAEKAKAKAEKIANDKLKREKAQEEAKKRA